MSVDYDLCADLCLTSGIPAQVAICTCRRDCEDSDIFEAEYGECIDQCWEDFGGYEYNYNALHTCEE
jgi:hypothetical protein